MIHRVVFLVAAGVVVTTPIAAFADSIEQGRALFTSQKCVMCHSVGDTGNKKGALDGVGVKLNADEIRQWLTAPDAMREKTKSTRTPAMKDPKLTKDQVEALVAFLSAQKSPNAHAR